MSAAPEYSCNAKICEDLATAARLEKERNAWLKMKTAWLARADQEEIAQG